MGIKAIVGALVVEVVVVVARFRLRKFCTVMQWFICECTK